MSSTQPGDKQANESQAMEEKMFALQTAVEKSIDEIIEVVNRLRIEHPLWFKRREGLGEALNILKKNTEGLI
jgi:hypothetical protein